MEKLKLESVKQIGKFKIPEQSCCHSPDIKNEGYVLIDNYKVWEYHCYNCGKTWTEKETKKTWSVKK